MKKKRRLLSALLCLGVLSLTLTAAFTASAGYGYAQQAGPSSGFLSLEHEAMALNVGDEAENPVLQWDDGGGNTVLSGFVWQSSNERVVRVSQDGQISAVSPGIARLTAEGEFQGSGVSLSCDVAVAGRTDDGVCIKGIILTSGQEGMPDTVAIYPDEVMSANYEFLLSIPRWRYDEILRMVEELKQAGCTWADYEVSLRSHDGKQEEFPVDYRVGDSDVTFSFSDVSALVKKEGDPQILIEYSGSDMGNEGLYSGKLPAPAWLDYPDVQTALQPLFVSRDNSVSMDLDNPQNPAILGNFSGIHSMELLDSQGQKVAGTGMARFGTQGERSETDERYGPYFNGAPIESPVTGFWGLLYGDEPLDYGEYDLRLNLEGGKTALVNGFVRVTGDVVYQLQDAYAAGEGAALGLPPAVPGGQEAYIAASVYSGTIDHREFQVKVYDQERLVGTSDSSRLGGPLKTDYLYHVLLDGDNRFEAGKTYDLRLEPVEAGTTRPCGENTLLPADSLAIYDWSFVGSPQEACYLFDTAGGGDTVPSTDDFYLFDGDNTYYPKMMSWEQGQLRMEFRDRIGQILLLDREKRYSLIERSGEKSKELLCHYPNDYYKPVPAASMEETSIYFNGDASYRFTVAISAEAVTKYGLAEKAQALSAMLIDASAPYPVKSSLCVVSKREGSAGGWILEGTIEGIQTASSDRYFLVIGEKDPGGEAIRSGAAISAPTFSQEGIAAVHEYSKSRNVKAYPIPNSGGGGVPASVETAVDPYLITKGDGLYVEFHLRLLNRTAPEDPDFQLELETGGGVPVAYSDFMVTKQPATNVSTGYAVSAKLPQGITKGQILHYKLTAGGRELINGWNQKPLYQGLLTDGPVEVKELRRAGYVSAFFVEPTPGKTMEELPLDLLLYGDDPMTPQHILPLTYDAASGHYTLTNDALSQEEWDKAFAWQVKQGDILVGKGDLEGRAKFLPAGAQVPPLTDGLRVADLGLYLQGGRVEGLYASGSHRVRGVFQNHGKEQALITLHAAMYQEDRMIGHVMQSGAVSPYGGRELQLDMEIPSHCTLLKLFLLDEAERPYCQSKKYF